MRLVRVRSMKKIRPSTACAWFLCGALEISATFGLRWHALADEASDAREGEALATKICSDCHVVSPKVGPPFAEIAKGSRAAPEALRDFLHSTHSDVGHPGAMPNHALPERQIDEIAAYLATLRAAK
jgi:mono/diheme cytochrome c family protein